MVVEVQEVRAPGSDSPFWFYALLGSIFSAFAIVSLMVRIFDIGLAPVMQQTLNYYRELVHPIAEVLLDGLRWVWPDLILPEWVKDLYAISFVGGAVAGRALLSVGQGSPGRIVGSTLVAIVIGLTFAGLAMVLFWLVQVLLPFFSMGMSGPAFGGNSSRWRRTWGSTLSLWTVLLLVGSVMDMSELGLSGNDGPIVIVAAATLFALVILVALIGLLSSTDHMEFEAGIEPTETLIAKFSSNATILMPMAIFGAVIFFAANSQV